MLIGQSVADEKKLNKIKRKLRFRAGTVFVHVITMNQGDDLFDIWNAASLKEKHLRKHFPMIVGIAGSEEEANNLVVSEIAECVKNGKLPMKQYFNNRFGIN